MPTKEERDYMDGLDKDELRYNLEECLDEIDELKGNYYPNIAIITMIVVSFFFGMVIGMNWMW